MQRKLTADTIRGTLRQAWSAQYWLRFAATLCICGSLAWISYDLPSSHVYAKLIWIPVGAALVAVWRWGFGMLPAVAMAEFFPSLAMAHLPGDVCGTLGSVAEVAFTVWLLRRLDLHPEFDRVRDVLWFAAIALILSPAVGALLVVTALRLIGLIAPGEFWSTALMWWIGDADGILMLSPLLLLLGDRRSRNELKQRWGEFLALSGCWGLVELWILRTSRLPAMERYPFNDLLDPLLLWAALRFGPVGIAILGPLAMLQAWAVQLGGFRSLPEISLTRPASYPLINILTVWISVLVLASVVWESRGAEAEFQESNRVLTALVNTLPVAILSVDSENRVLECNRAAESLFGWERQERIGNPLDLEDDGELTGRLRALPQAAPLHGVETSWRPAGHEEARLLRLYTARLESENAAKAGAIALIADVTGQRALEERFQQVQKLEKVGRLAGGIAQDFQRLLGVVQDEAEIVRHESQEDSVRSRALEMQVTADRAFALTRQLLAFSRRQPVEPGDIDLNQAILSCLPLLRQLAGTSVTVNTRLEAPPGRVCLTQPQLEQILLNLVVNARDAMPKGGHLELATLNGPDHPTEQGSSGRYFGLIVTDTGSGMSPEVQARAFEPFFTTKDVGRGSGLGLATVYGILQQVGGQVRLWSQPNVGTRFEILLPRIGTGIPG